MKNTSHRKTFSGTDLLLYASSFFISVTGMLLILKSRGFYPFKENTLFIMDMHSQFMEFFASLRYTISGDNSLFYSWSRSLGGNYLGLYAYYLASPLSWITVLFPIEKMHTAILVLTLSKIGCCGLTFSLFSSYLWDRCHPFSGEKDADRSRRWHKLILLPLAVSYALISYNITYSFCLMWIDGVILLPLVLLGLEKILDGHKGLFYILALTASFVCNYFTGYMVGIFTAVYLLFRLCTLVTRANFTLYLHKVLRFAVTTFLSIGLAAPLLLAVWKDLASGRLTANSYRAETITNFPFSDLLKQFTNGSYHSITYEAIPNIYCGYAALALALLFFAIRRIPLRERLAAAGVVLFLVLSLYLTKLNYFWHAFMELTGFSHRYAFVFSFFMLYLGVRTVSALPVVKLPSILQRKPLFECVVLLFMAVVAIDMGTNGRTILYGLENEYDYDTLNFFQENLAAVKPLSDDILRRDDGFYRVNQGYEYANNDAMLLGFNGMAHYSSTFNQTVNSLTLRLGFAQSHYWNSGHGSTPLTDSLFGVKYHLHNAPMPAFYTELVSTEYGTSSYLNPYALPLVYSAPLSDSTVSLDSISPFANQNLLLNSITDSAIDYFTPLEYDTEGNENGWSYSFTADSGRPVYLYMQSQDFSSTSVLVNGKEAGSYFTKETDCILYLGSFAPGEQVTVSVLPSTAVHVDYIEIAELNTELLQDTLLSLQANGIQLTSHKGGKLKGTIYVPEGQKIVTSIPYDPGWTIRIDGKKAPFQKYADTFISLEAEEGTHTISFSYIPPGFGTGVIFFLISLVLSFLYFRIRTSVSAFSLQEKPNAA